MALGQLDPGPRGSGQGRARAGPGPPRSPCSITHLQCSQVRHVFVSWTHSPWAITPAVASQPHCLHPPASVPLRSSASPLNFSMTCFNKVKLPASALLSDSLKAPKDAHATWWDTLWHIPINSFVDLQLQAPASLVTLVSRTLSRTYYFI